MTPEIAIAIALAYLDLTLIDEAWDPALDSAHPVRQKAIAVMNIKQLRVGVKSSANMIDKGQNGLGGDWD